MMKCLLSPISTLILGIFMGCVVLSLGVSAFGADIDEDIQFVTYQNYKTSIPGRDLVPRNILNTGAATYSIPIDVPPARGGVVFPRLTLNYNRHGKNGPLGVGWTLVIGAIERDTKKGLDYSGDAFLHNGSTELVPRTDWGSNYFGARIEGGFSKYQFLSDTQGWVVYGRDGTRYYYGRSSASRHENAHGVFRWRLDRVLDRNNNEMTLTYWKDTANGGALYIGRIDYPYNNYLTFHRESRSDATPDYQTHEEVKIAYRLKEIRVYGNGQQAGKYVLDYDQGGMSGFSRVTEVQRYGSDFSTTLPPITFQWQDGGGGSFTDSNITNLQSGNFKRYVHFADVNGDGMSDLVRGITSSLFNIHLSNGDGTLDPTPKVLDPSDSTSPIYIHLRDVDGDGDADLIKHSTGHIYTYLSNGDGTFQGVIETDVQGGTSNSRWARCADQNRDGLADFIFFTSNNVHVYFSNGDGTFEQQAVTTHIQFGSYNDYYTCADVDGDGLGDWITHGSGNLNVYLAQGDGSFGSPIRSDMSDTGNTKQIDVGDVNADGLTDVIRHSHSTGKVFVYLSRGDGSFTDNIEFSPSDSGDDRYVYLADVNGDGRTDLIRYSGSGLTHEFYTYLSNGDGSFQSKITSTLNNGYSSFLGYLRFDDVNGDGLDDLITHNQYGTTFTCHLADNETIEAADVIHTIRNGLNGTSTIAYGFFPNLSEPEHHMPFVLPIVKSIEVDDGVSSPFTEDYAYDGGYYDQVEREFRGFEETTQTHPDDTTEKSGFYTQHDYLKGKEQWVELRNPSDALLRKTSNQWETDPASPTTWGFVKLMQTRTDFYNSPTVYTREDYTYHAGNGHLHTRARTGTDGETVTETDLYVNKSDWLWRLSQETVEGGSTGKAREIFYTYDTRGNMLSRRDWHDRGSDPTVNLTPDAYGNLQSFTDARGYTTSISYDTTHTYPAVITYPATDDGKSHIVRYEAWDYRFGKVKTRRDERSYATQFDYDVFGRIEQVDYPDGGQVVTEYYDSPNPRYTLTRTKESAGSFIDAYTYRDGLDREVQRVSFGEGGKSIVFKTLYDNMGRVDMVYGPFFGSGSGYPQSPPGSSPYTDTAYDYRGRPTSVTSPDGTYGTVSTQYAYSGFTTTTTDPDSKTRAEKRDRLERIIRVTEHGGLNTDYTYNAAGDLLGVTDSAGNPLSFGVDSLGRRWSLDDPDLGHWEYAYDANGNLVSVDSPRADLGPGSVEAASNLLEYDPLGRVEREEKTIAGSSTTWVTRYAYDLAGKPETLTFHDGYVVTYGYHSGSGLLHTVTGSDAVSYATCTGYTPEGKIGTLAHANGITTTYGYDSKSRRLTQITTSSGLQNRSYQYSRAGDIKNITDQRRGRTYTYTYDNLHRLTGETGGPESVGYGYNNIGNITSRSVGSDAYSYTYDTTRKHAVQSVTLNGDPHAYTYDEAGNLTSGPDFTVPAEVAARSIGYNADNLPFLVEHTVQGGDPVRTYFVYDGEGKRVKKRVFGGSETYYLGEHFEVTDGVETKYIFAKDIRVARVTPSETHFYHKDHLGSSTVMTDSSGQEVEATEFLPYGSEREHSGQDTSMYRFTDQELDPETGLYNYDARLYDPVIGRFVSADNIIKDPYDPQTLNRYAYALNNPLKYEDPDGNIPLLIVPVIIGGAIAADLIYSSPANAPDRDTELQDRKSGAEAAFDAAAVGTSAAAVGGGFAARGILGGARALGGEVIEEVTGGITGLAKLAKGGGRGLLRRVKSLFKDEASKSTKRFSDEKQALVDMAKKDKRSGITPEDMQAYKDLNKELFDPFPSNKVRGPEIHPDRNFKKLHGHVGPVDHIPIKDK